MTPQPERDVRQRDQVKKLHIHTWGCQMNVYDSQRMADLLAPLGYQATDRAEEADLVILNTCHIREKATEKLFSELGRLRKAKSARREAGEAMIVAVAGCVAQAEGALVAERAPHVDLVLGPQSYHSLPELVARAARAAGEPIVLTEFQQDTKFDSLPEETLPRGASAFLSIQEGCDKFCSFCVVPYTRGAEFSRPAAGVLEEARRLVAVGACELTLLGQNVNAYHGGGPDGAGWDLARLIRAVAEIPGVARIRYTTSHPRDMSEALVEAHADVPALMPFIHLPVQSGSDRILRRMNRKHTIADYLGIVDRLRAARQDLALSTDFIVGHPGEQEKDFEATLALAEQIGFAHAYSFKYSPRPGTPAATASDQVEEPVKSERLARLQQVLNESQARFNQQSLGRTLPVLLDRVGSRSGQLHGRSPYMQSVHVAAPLHLLGKIADVTIESAHALSLTGRLDAPAGERA